MWPGLEALAHTLAYDAACLGDGRPPARLETITQPTLVVTGGEGPMAGLFHPAADSITASVPNAARRTLEGQSHVADPRVLGPALARFFTGG